MLITEQGAKGGTLCILVHSSVSLREPTQTSDMNITHLLRTFKSILLLHLDSIPPLWVVDREYCHSLHCMSYVIANKAIAEAVKSGRARNLHSRHFSAQKPDMLISSLFVQEKASKASQCALSLASGQTLWCLCAPSFPWSSQAS